MGQGPLLRRPLRPWSLPSPPSPPLHQFHPRRSLTSAPSPLPLPSLRGPACWGVRLSLWASCLLPPLFSLILSLLSSPSSSLHSFAAHSPSPSPAAPLSLPHLFVSAENGLLGTVPTLQSLCRGDRAAEVSSGTGPGSRPPGAAAELGGGGGDCWGGGCRWKRPVVRPGHGEQWSGNQLRCPHGAGIPRRGAGSGLRGHSWRGANPAPVPGFHWRPSEDPAGWVGYTAGESCPECQPRLGSSTAREWPLAGLGLGAALSLRM